MQYRKYCKNYKSSYKKGQSHEWFCPFVRLRIFGIEAVNIFFLVKKKLIVYNTA